jgi:hypothetical protein
MTGKKLKSKKKKTITELLEAGELARAQHLRELNRRAGQRRTASLKQLTKPKDTPVIEPGESVVVHISPTRLETDRQREYALREKNAQLPAILKNRYKMDVKIKKTWHPRGTGGMNILPEVGEYFDNGKRYVGFPVR